MLSFREKIYSRSIDFGESFYVERDEEEPKIMKSKSYAVFPAYKRKRVHQGQNHKEASSESSEDQNTLK